MTDIFQGKDWCINICSNFKEAVWSGVLRTWLAILSLNSATAAGSPE